MAYLPGGALFNLDDRRIAGLVSDADGDLCGMSMRTSQLGEKLYSGTSGCVPKYVFAFLVSTRPKVVVSRRLQPVYPGPIHAQPCSKGAFLCVRRAILYVFSQARFRSTSPILTGRVLILPIGS